MVVNKNLFYYGKTFHILFDPFLKEARKNLLNLVPDNSKVFDAGSGTGALSLLFRQKNNCQVVGADLSLKMIDFARKSNPYNNVTFLHMDISNITEYEENSFDYSIMCQVIHELPSDKQLEILAELMRIGQNTIILDYNIPLPKNTMGLAMRMVEATFGRDHYNNFKSYITSGGIIGILEKAGLQSKITRRFAFKRNCQQIVLLGS